MDQNEVMRGRALEGSTDVNHIENIFVGGFPDGEHRTARIPVSMTRNTSFLFTF